MKNEINKKLENLKLKNQKITNNYSLIDNVEFIEEKSPFNSIGKFYSGHMRFLFYRNDRDLGKLVLDNSELIEDNFTIYTFEKKKVNLFDGKDYYQCYYAFNPALDDVLDFYRSKGIKEGLLFKIKNKYGELVGNKSLDCFNTITEYESVLEVEN